MIVRQINYRLVQSVFRQSSSRLFKLDLLEDVKGVPMLKLGSDFEDETLTIRLATLENLGIFGRKYPAAHLDEIRAKLAGMHFDTFCFPFEILTSNPSGLKG